jgi:4-alpha-glucanotransferase
VRIDHFRGIAAYWEVPAGDETALGGRWVTGPGEKLFAAAEAALGELPVVAEDLGEITPDVRALLADLGFPGMRILQFAFQDPDSSYLPHNLVKNCIVYTGTHDNDTTRGWFDALDAPAREKVLAYVGGDGSTIAWDLLRVAFTSLADRAIVPMQDVLGLGTDARMNRPGEATGNWTWRARGEDFTAERAAGLRKVLEVSGRLRT